MTFTLTPLLPANIQRVLLASTLDGAPVSDWLQCSTVEMARKACLLNVLAVCCIRPNTKTPIISFIDAVFAVKLERIYVTLAGTTPRFLEVACRDWALPFYEDIESPLQVHYEMLADLPLTFVGDFTHVPLRSFRAEGAPSLQIVIADRYSNNQTIADCDLDAHNPDEDIFGLFGHLWELWTGRKVGGITDHLAMWQTLRDGPAAPFLGYTLG